MIAWINKEKMFVSAPSYPSDVFERFSRQKYPDFFLINRKLRDFHCFSCGFWNLIHYATGLSLKHSHSLSRNKGDFRLRMRRKSGLWSEVIRRTEQPDIFHNYFYLKNFKPLRWPHKRAKLFYKKSIWNSTTYWEALSSTWLT